MWSRFGDLSEGPPGTFFLAKGEPLTYFWNMYDQVLLRPDLMDALVNGDPRVLTSTGTTALVQSDGRPDERSASDHLPVYFRLEFK
jgi:hypothetical protein